MIWLYIDKSKYTNKRADQKWMRRKADFISERAVTISFRSISIPSGILKIHFIVYSYVILRYIFLFIY